MKIARGLRAGPSHAQVRQHRHAEYRLRGDGPTNGDSVLLMHGWPYDPRTYDGVVAKLTAASCRTVVPYLRGFGPTRFLHRHAALRPASCARRRSERLHGRARAAARGARRLDWGGRAACIVAALWPERARCLVTGDGYNIQDIPNANTPAAPEQELRYWYQHYFNTERGAAGLAANRRELIRLLWRLWSPLWAFDDATFAPSVPSWDNPDFVDVTISSYRHRYGNAPGDPTLEAIEQRLTAQPPIPVPACLARRGQRSASRIRGVSTNAGSPAARAPAHRRRRA